MVVIFDSALRGETFRLGNHDLPRLFNGLWQLSSNSWGSAPAAKIRRQMAIYAENGYTAFADHYGPAEILFGEFREKWSDPQEIFGATKWCVFRTVEPTRALVEEAVDDRLARMQSHRIDLLQFHWQDYDDTRYLKALHHLKDLQGEGKIGLIGLCNFNSAVMDEICTELGSGTIVSNQVQFSLIDVRPLYAMAEVCNRHNVKLLTYGTLCGGFLADAWLGKEEPDLYSGSLTPSQRKYLDMITRAWGSWSLFQDLLKELRAIADKYDGMSIANVATRWVLDHPFVGAVIIGVRMGVSEHTDDNQKVYSFRLDGDDRVKIEAVLARSNGAQLINSIGDCGAEYR
ncbi:aldo/keto reductase [Dichomitus squalens]|uniref:Aldo/keto reductase n=1 Tax=Dichomitus squalens TaxID=114155 RepID=A0A4Q9Q9K1_9APHY|nr:aldo/keto reductase [Dichomitus squalens]TBU64287.1 aldo/keto reductase [Dichomitus squalens]